MIRVGYGAALVLMPGTTIFLATGRLPGRRTRRVAQVLGVRHLAQAALTAAAPRPGVFAIGWQVDAVHAASMLLLAAVSRAVPQCRPDRRADRGRVRRRGVLGVDR